MSQDQPNHCLRCGYNLHGNTSGKCPECGLGATVIVGVSDPQQFHRAQAALERDDLLVRVMAPAVGEIGSIYAYGSPNNTGWFWVDATQLDRVEACLDEAGVASWIGNLPIVDRSEPICPSCDAKLDVNGPEECPTCRKPFQWVDIEMPEVDPTGVHCKTCGYELTGNTSGRCPECNAQVPEPTLDAIVAAASKEMELQADVAIAQSISCGRFNMAGFLVAGFSIVIPTMIVLSVIFGAMMRSKVYPVPLTILFASIVAVALGALYWAVRASMPRGKHDGLRRRP